MNPNTKLLLRWCFWFFLGNTALFWIIGLKYLPVMPWLHSTLLNAHSLRHIYSFVTFSYLGQFSLLAFIPCFLMSGLALFLPRYVIFSMSIVVASAATIVLAIDAFTFNLFRFHLNGMIFSLLLRSATTDIFDLSSREILLGFGLLGSTIFVETLLAWVVWRFIIIKQRLCGLGYWFSAILGISLYFSYYMVLLSANWGYELVALMETGRSFPLYANVLSYLLPNKDSIINLARFGELYTYHGEGSNHTMHYPLQPLQFNKQNNHLNVVLIVIDAWRADMLNPQVMPTIYQFSKQSWYFANHFSGGNATGPGLFSLFYGMPATYWPVVAVHNQPPLFIQTLLQQHYLIKNFPSATMKAPDVGSLVFSSVGIPTDQMPGSTTDARDRQITQQFKTLLNTIDKTKQPFFSFLFYDGAHSYCSFNPSATPFKPFIKVCNRPMLDNASDPVPYFNRYRNAVYFLDQQIHEVLTSLKQHHLMDNTVIIITGDHGEEFNDSHLNYWGHASAFTPAQIHIPLIVYWPGEKPQTISHLTSHYDVAPTLMRKLFACTSPTATYSYGYDLLNAQARPYLLIKSYVDFAIREPNQVTRIYSTGNYELNQLNGKPLGATQVNAKALENIFTDLQRFYR